MLKQKTVEYVEELDMLMGLVITAMKDVKAGKGPLVIGGELLPALIQVLSGIGQLNDELKNVRVVEETLGYRLGELVSVLTEVK